MERRETGPAKNLRARSWEQQEETAERRRGERVKVVVVVVGSGERVREREDREVWWVRKEVREEMRVRER